jgi:oligoendopeptidase F
MNWDLTSYFAAFDGPEMRLFKDQLRIDIDGLSDRATALPALCESPDAAPSPDHLAQWEGVLLCCEELSRRLSHMASYLSCLTAADTRNEEYKSAEAAFGLTAVAADKITVELKRGLRDVAQVSWDALLARSALDGCQHFLRRLRQDAQQTMEPTNERLNADLSVDGIHAWGRLYSAVAGRLEFDMAFPDAANKRLPISQRRSLMGSADRRVRRAAFEGGNAAWAAVEDTAAAALNAIAGTRLTLNRHRGIDNFLDVALFQAAISRASLEAMFEAIFDSAELPRRILALKADALGQDGVAWYDLEASLPLPDETPISWEAAKQMVITGFNQAYPKLGAFTESVFERQWIDWEPRPGKQSGGFCTGSQLSNESRIFMTYNETIGDVRTLAHEAGHAFHSFILREARPYARRYPMTLAESASTFAEMILTDGMLSAGSALSDVERLRLLDMETAHAAVYLTDIPVRYEFEKAFHEERQTGEVSVSRLKELMRQTQQRVFGDLLEAGGDDPYFWASKLHFYITSVTFYNFPYTFGFLLSRGLFSLFKQQGGEEFYPRYEQFLGSTGSATAEEVARRTLGCDLESPAFWKEAIETLRQPVEQLEQAFLKESSLPD